MQGLSELLSLGSFRPIENICGPNKTSLANFADENILWSSFLIKFFWPLNSNEDLFWFLPRVIIFLEARLFYLIFLISENSAKKCGPLKTFMKAKCGPCNMGWTNFSYTLLLSKYCSVSCFWNSLKTFCAMCV